MRLSHSELTTMTGQIPSAVTPTTHVDVEKRVLITNPDSLRKWAESKGIATDMGNVYLESLFMKYRDKKYHVKKYR